MGGKVGRKWHDITYIEDRGVLVGRAEVWIWEDGTLRKRCVSDDRYQY